MVDECEGCMNVEVVGLHRPKTRCLRRRGRSVSKIAMEIKKKSWNGPQSGPTEV